MWLDALVEYARKSDKGNVVYWLSAAHPSKLELYGFWKYKWVPMLGILALNLYRSMNMLRIRERFQSLRPITKNKISNSLQTRYWLAIWKRPYICNKKIGITLVVPPSYCVRRSCLCEIGTIKWTALSVNDSCQLNVLRLMILTD